MLNVVAIDIGGSKMVAGYVDLLSGELIRVKKLVYSQKPDKEYILNTIIEMIDDISENSDYEGIGLTIPGLCDAQKGEWIYSPFSGIKNFSIAKILKQKYNKKIFIENDINACALAEKFYGCCKDTSDFAWVTLSNGCGGSLFLNNELYGGYNNAAGEVCHMCVDYTSEIQCGCGNYGCLEALASGSGIAQIYKMRKGLKNAENINGEYVANLAKNGDEIAIEIYNNAGVYIGRALAALANTTNPQKIVLGGGVSLSYELFEKTMMQTFDKHLFNQGNTEIEIQLTGLGYYAALKGAAVLCLKLLEENEYKVALNNKVV